MVELLHRISASPVRLDLELVDDPQLPLHERLGPSTDVGQRRHRQLRAVVGKVSEPGLLGPPVEGGVDQPVQIDIAGDGQIGTGIALGEPSDRRPHPVEEATGPAATEHDRRQGADHEGHGGRHRQFQPGSVAGGLDAVDGHHRVAQSCRCRPSVGLGHHDPPKSGQRVAGRRPLVDDRCRRELDPAGRVGQTEGHLNRRRQRIGAEDDRADPRRVVRRCRFGQQPGLRGRHRQLDRRPGTAVDDGLDHLQPQVGPDNADRLPGSVVDAGRHGDGGRPVVAGCQAERQPVVPGSLPPPLVTTDQVTAPRAGGEAPGVGVGHGVEAADPIGLGGQELIGRSRRGEAVATGVGPGQRAGLDGSRHDRRVAGPGRDGGDPGPQLHRNVVGCQRRRLPEDVRGQLDRRVGFGHPVPESLHHDQGRAGTDGDGEDRHHHGAAHDRSPNGPSPRSLRHRDSRRRRGGPFEGLDGQPPRREPLRLRSPPRP